MISIPGLTPLQVEICEKIWSMDTQEEILSWFDVLPHRMRVQAYAMLQLIVAEMIDQQELTHEDLAEARDMLSRLK